MYIKVRFWFCIVLLITLFNNFCYAKKPDVIPSLKDWQDKSGSFQFNKFSRLVVDSKDKSKLEKIAKTLQEDLDAFKGYQNHIVYSTTPKKGDIFLTISSTNISYNQEEYIFDISDFISISSNFQAGIFNGTRTLLQLLKQSDTIQNGTAHDWPSYKERGMMVDVARKFYSYEWLKIHIKELSYLKLNILHLHLSDNEGFRINCEKYPEITSFEHYTKAEIRELVKIAEKYFVTIIPEIDMPSHMLHILKTFTPKYSLKDNKGNYYSYLDFANEDARQFAKSIIEEFISLFPGPYWHNGSDEFLESFDSFHHLKIYAQKKFGPSALSKDAFIDYINWVDSIVKIHGKKLRIWNDGISTNDKPDSKYTIKLNSDIIIEYWKNGIDPNELISNGHQLVNCNLEYLYYVIGHNWKPNNQMLFLNWKPDIFNGSNIKISESNGILGSKLHIWGDIPDAENEVQVAKGIGSILRFLSQLNWNPTDSTIDFNTLNKRISIIGNAPGVTFPKNATPENLAYGKKVVASSIESFTNFFPENIVDSDHNSRWSSHYLDSQWIYIDFGENIQFNRIKILWEWSYALDYNIQISDDTLNWTSIYHNSKSDGYLDDISGINCNGRFLRIFCNKRFGHFGFSLFEIEVYNKKEIHSTITTQNQKVDIKCYPNPFSSTLEFQYTTYSASNNSIQLFNIQGNNSFNLFNGRQEAGTHIFTWDTKELESGIYFLNLQIDNELFSKNIIHVK